MQEVSRFSDGDWFLLIAITVAACVCLFAALRMFHRARLIEDMPTSKIRSCPQGYVELFGTAKWMEGPEIYAPLSGQPCVWYSYSIEKYTGNSKQKWRYVEGGVSEELFLLEDETGSCVINPEGAEVVPSSSQTWTGPKLVKNDIKNKSVSTMKVIGDVLMSSISKYRYTERRLDQFESLYAIGEYSSMGTGYHENLKDAASSSLRELKRNKEKLAEYDRNDDSQIDLDEWEVARKDAKQAAIEQQLSSPLPKRMHVLKKPQTKKYQPFLLSSKSETQMSRKNLVFSIVLAVMFIILISIAFLKLLNMI